MTRIAHRYNENIDALEVDPDFLEEGLAHAAREGHRAIRIYELNQRSGATMDLDLSPFAGNTTITSLSISDSFRPDRVSLEGLYDMPALTMLSWQDKQIRPELERLPNLEVLHASWSKGLKGFDSLKKLRHLLVTSLAEKDCSVMAGLAALEELRLGGGTFESLRGIEGLERLREVKLGHSPKLADAAALGRLKSLKKLHVEKCGRLHDFAFLADAANLEELFVSELDSITFVPRLQRLKLLKFWNLADGNVAPALEAPALAQVDLFPDRQHYTHTKAQVNALLAQKA